jgi:hypothetical protein
MKFHYYPETDSLYRLSGSSQGIPHIWSMV